VGFVGVMQLPLLAMDATHLSAAVC